MQIPVQVTFRGMPVSDAFEQACWDEASRLERHFDRIMSCRVVVALASSRSRQSGLDVRIDLKIPGREIVVSREPSPDRTDEDPRVALHEAFESARRQLESFATRRREQERAPEAM